MDAQVSRDVHTKRELKAHVWDKDPLNWYVEEPWCNSRLFDVEIFNGGVHDPCCGSGQIAAAARNAGYENVTFSDVMQRSIGEMPTWFELDHVIQDYATDPRVYDNIVTNPPFDPCNKDPYPFVEWALSHAAKKVALILPLKWLAGDKRSRWLSTKPLRRVYVLTPRPSMPPGEYLVAGNKAGGGKKDFAWFVFDRSHNSALRSELTWLHRDGGTDDGQDHQEATP